MAGCGGEKGEKCQYSTYIHELMICKSEVCNSTFLHTLDPIKNFLPPSPHTHKINNFDNVL